MSKNRYPYELPPLPVIDYSNPNITQLLFVNQELTKAFINLRRLSIQQNLNLSRVSKERQQIVREFNKLELASLPPSKELEKRVTIREARLAKIQHRDDDSIETQEKSGKGQETYPSSLEENQESKIRENSARKENFEGQKNQKEEDQLKRNEEKGVGKERNIHQSPKMTNDLELVYRDRLNETEKMKEKYFNKYKSYKQKYPKQDYEQFRNLVLEKEKELAVILQEKKRLEEELKSSIMQSHELKQSNYRYEDQNNILKKEYFDMERKNQLLMEELSVMAAQNNELITENMALKEIMEEKEKGNEVNEGNSKEIYCESFIFNN